MASHAHSTRTPLLRQTIGSAGLLPASIRSGRIVAAGGPVTHAMAVMASADPDHARIRNLRRSLAQRIEHDLALLDALDGDSDLEPSLSAVEPYPWQGQDTWSAGSPDDRENAECEDCDGHAVRAGPYRLVAA